MGGKRSPNPDRTSPQIPNSSALTFAMDNALDQIADKCSKYLQAYRTPIIVIESLTAQRTAYPRTDRTMAESVKMNERP